MMDYMSDLRNLILISNVVFEDKITDIDIQDIVPEEQRDELISSRGLLRRVKATRVLTYWIQGWICECYMIDYPLCPEWMDEEDYYDGRVFGIDDIRMLHDDGWLQFGDVPQGMQDRLRQSATSDGYGFLLNLQDYIQIGGSIWSLLQTIGGNEWRA